MYGNGLLMEYTLSFPINSLQTNPNLNLNSPIDSDVEQPI